jgi:subtilase family serine protease
MRAMLRARRAHAAGAAALLTGLTLASASVQASAMADPAQPLPGSAIPFTASSQVMGNAPGAQRLSIQVWLRPRVAAAQRFADAVSTPGSPLFGHFLSPDRYTARFGATRGEARGVAAWLRSAGFAGVGADAQRTYVRATAATSTIEAALRTRLRLYRSSATTNAGPYALRANDGAVSVPASLADSVIGVTGLDNAAPLVSPMRPSTGLAGSRRTATGASAGGRAPCSRYYAQHHVTGLPRQFGVTSFPTDICGYSAGQLRTAYGASASATGRGQTIVLVELGLAKDMFLTLQDYARANKMPAPSRQRYSQRSLGRGDACGDPFDLEEQIDVESSYDMAPGANQLVVGGDSCNTGDYGQQGLIDADVAVLNGAGHRPLASVASNSWETGGESQAPELTTIEHAILVRAAAEGVGMYVAAGDGSGVEAPSSDPFAIAVGGTTLGIGRNGHRLFVTGWSTGFSVIRQHRWVLQSENGASGGGPSLEWSQPGYQRQVVPAALAHPRSGDHSKTLVRAVPDVSADADPFTGFGTGLLSFPVGKPPAYSETDYGGTSLATPLVAGIVAAAQQGQHRPFGFINPVLYRLAGTRAFTGTLPLSGSSPAGFRGVFCGVPDCPFQALITSDDQSTSLLGYTGQVTLSGYDNMTGVGTPNGAAFIHALRKLES